MFSLLARFLSYCLFSLIMLIKRINENIYLKSFVYILLFYTVFHFFYSGVFLPLTGNPGFVHPEAEQVERFVEQGFKGQTAMRYGPLYSLIILMLLSFDPILNNWGFFLLLLDYFFLFFSLILAYYAFFKSRPYSQLSFIIGIIILFNFSSVYYVLFIKNVDIWQMFLIFYGFYFFLREKYFKTAVSLVSATFIKLLPAFFLNYMIMRNKRVLFGVVIVSILILSTGQFVFGVSDFGFKYVYNIGLKIINPSKDSVAGSAWFENNSIKGILLKAFAGFKLGSNSFNIELDPLKERIAGIIYLITAFSGWVYVLYLGYNVKTDDKTTDLINLGIVSVVMLLISPSTSLEYTILLIPAFMIGCIFILYFNIPKSFHIYFLLAYLLLGHLVPLSIFQLVLPLDYLNIVLENHVLNTSTGESYKMYGFTFSGMVFLLIFFLKVSRFNSNKLLKEES